MIKYVKAINSLNDITLDFTTKDSLTNGNKHYNRVSHLSNKSPLERATEIIKHRLELLGKETSDNETNFNELKRVADIFLVNKGKKDWIYLCIVIK